MIESEFSFTTLRQRLALRQTCAPDSCFDIFRVPKKVEKLRHLEVWDEAKQKLVPATIIRSSKHLLWIRFEHLNICTPPKIYSCR